MANKKEIKIPQEELDKLMLDHFKRRAEDPIWLDGFKIEFAAVMQVNPNLIKQLIKEHRATLERL